MRDLSVYRFVLFEEFDIAESISAIHRCYAANLPTFCHTVLGGIGRVGGK
jgi:hypothetical protein